MAAADRFDLDRRNVLKGILWGGAATAVTGAAALAPARHAAAAPGRTRRYTIDVACLGDTLRIDVPPGATPPTDLYGTSFLVEGLIYDKGTIPDGDGFDPKSEPSIGVWLCHGWIMIHPRRPQPHVISTQEYLIGAFGGKKLTPTDQLVSQGLEGADEPTQPALRSVIGGTGGFAGATGVVLQHVIGTNIVPSGPGGLFGSSPNFRFKFDLRGGASKA